VIFSQLDPSRGHYEYFESPSTAPGLNDDLPVPTMPRSTELGVPSTECGRALPADAVHVGSGEYAVGLVSYPAHSQQLAGSGAGLTSRAWPFWALLGGAFAAGWIVASRKRIFG
jgi:hypothetical protein